MARDRNHIGSYRLLKLIRAGASCQIWEVISEIDNRRCALKALQEEFQSDREEIALLKHEFVVGEPLKHQNVIEIYEFNITKGVPYLALEYFESHNLKQWLRSVDDRKILRKHLPSIVKQTAEGLNYLHQQGWIHRDIKPDNFLLNQEVKVKLIDFAIAQRVKKGLAKMFSGKTKIQGTRSYMSPEQIRGEKLDERSDIYSYGCMLFEFFAGRPPFTGGSPDELLQKHLRAAVPSIAAMADDVSPDFAKLVTRMMSKKRDRRPASMQEFIQSIDSMRIVKVDRG